MKKKAVQVGYWLDIKDGEIVAIPDRTRMSLALMFDPEAKRMIPTQDFTRRLDLLNQILSHLGKQTTEQLEAFAEDLE